MLSFFKNIFGKKECDISGEDCEYFTSPVKSREELLSSIDFSEYADVKYLSNNPGAKTIFILDDIDVTEDIYTIDYGKIKQKYDKDIFKEFTVIGAFGTNAGFMAEKFIRESNVQIDYAILDINLGNMLRLGVDDFIEFDGIEIAHDLVLKYPNAKFIFSTAHTLNNKNSSMIYYFNRFAELFDNKVLSDYGMDKKGDRVTNIYNFLYKD